MMDWPTMVWVHATGFPCASSPAAKRSCHMGRYQPPARSSSRVHTTLTGALATLATLTASMTKSEAGFARRPKPPPRSVVLILTFSGGRPAVLAALARSTVSNCVPVQSSQLSARKSTTQLSGSIMACARYGTSYSAVMVFAALERAPCGSPFFLAMLPGLEEVLENSSVIFDVERPAFSPSSHLIFNLSRPSFAAQ